MRDVEIGFADHQVAEQENIEIEGARPVGDSGGAVAAEFAFDVQQGGKEFTRVEGSFDAYYRVQKTGLVLKANGRGGIEGGAGYDAAERSDALNCGGHRGIRRSGGAGEIGAQADISGAHTFQDYRGERESGPRVRQRASIC